MAEFRIDLVARFAQFQDSLNQVNRQVTSSAASMNRAFGAVKATLAAIGVGISLEGMRSLVQSSIDAADHLNDLSKKTGIAVDTLGGLGFAAKQAGGDLDSFADAATKLNRSIAEAGAGDKAKGEVFKTLGINVKDATGQLKTADQVMAELADKFASYADGPNKVAIAIALLGKAGADQIPVLNEGGQALLRNIEYYKRFSGVTQDVAEQADQFNDTLTKLRLLSGALGTNIASSLLPTLQGLADQLLEAKEKSTLFKDVSEGLNSVIKGLAIGVFDLAKGYELTGKSLAGLLAIRERLFAGDLKGAQSISQALVQDFKDGAVAIKDFEQSLRRVGQFKPTATDREDAEAGRFRIRGAKPQAPGIPDASRLAESARLAGQQAKELERIRDSQIASSRRAQDADLKALEDYAAQVKKIGDEVKERQYYENIFGAEAIEGLSTDDLKTKLKLLLEGVDEVAAIADRAALAYAGFDENGKSLNRTLEETNNFARDVGLTFTLAFEDAVAGGKDLDDILKAIEQDLARLLIRKAVTEPIGNAITGAIGNSGLSGLFSGLFGGGASNLSSAPGYSLGRSLFVGSYASGTDYVPRTGLALVHQGERITPAGQSGAVDARTFVTMHNPTADAIPLLQQALIDHDRKIGQLMSGDPYRRSGVTRRIYR
jgi:hypothetical protein